MFVSIVVKRFSIKRNGKVRLVGVLKGWWVVL